MNTTHDPNPAEKGILLWFLKMAFQQKLGGSVLAAVAEQAFSEAKAQGVLLARILRGEVGKLEDSIPLLEDHLRTLVSYRNTTEVLLVILRRNLVPHAGAARTESSEPGVPKKKSAQGYPGKRFGLTAEQSAMLLVQVFNDGSSLGSRVISALIKNKITTFGQLVETTQLMPAKLLRFSYIGAAIVAKVAAAMRAQGLTPKDPRKGKNAKTKTAPAAEPPTATDAEPWKEFGFTESAWNSTLKKFFPPKMGPRTNKARKIIGKRRVTVGELYTATQLKLSRIGKYFGKGCGPGTRAFIRETVLALAAPPIVLGKPTGAGEDVSTVLP